MKTSLIVAAVVSSVSAISIREKLAHANEHQHQHHKVASHAHAHVHAHVHQRQHQGQGARSHKRQPLPPLPPLQPNDVSLPPLPPNDVSLPPLPPTPSYSAYDDESQLYRGAASDSAAGGNNDGYDIVTPYGNFKKELSTSHTFPYQRKHVVARHGDFTPVAITTTTTPLPLVHNLPPELVDQVCEFSNTKVQSLLNSQKDDHQSCKAQLHSETIQDYFLAQERDACLKLNAELRKENSKLYVDKLNTQNFIDQTTEEFNSSNAELEAKKAEWLSSFAPSKCGSIEECEAEKLTIDAENTKKMAIITKLEEQIAKVTEAMTTLCESADADCDPEDTAVFEKTNFGCPAVATAATTTTTVAPSR